MTSWVDDMDRAMDENPEIFGLVHDEMGNAVEAAKYWYFITSYFCPQCARSREYRERRYTPRPENWEDRHEDIEAWDNCD